jgi:hypothetical protein
VSSQDKNLSERVEYNDSGVGTDGIMSELPAKLAGSLEFDGMKLDEQPASKRITLWFRQGAKFVFRIRLVRKGGRYIVEMAGMDPNTVLREISVCKRHFDQWFGITPQDVVSYELKRKPKTRSANRKAGE